MDENKKNRTLVTIFGDSYTITGDETAAHVKKVAGIVDKKMREIKSMNPNLNTEKIAVLTAVNTVHEYMKLQEAYDQHLIKHDRIKD